LRKGGGLGNFEEHWAVIRRVVVRRHAVEPLEAKVDVDRVRVAVEALDVGELRADATVGQDAGDRLYALWRLDAMTGLRRGELLGATWRGLDLDASTLTVSQQLVPTRGGCSFGPPKSKRGLRTIALDGETVDALRAHREAQLLERSFAGEAYIDQDLVFADELGGPIHPQRLTEVFGRQRKAAGIPMGTLHVLRHTHATHLLTNGVPVHVVAARLGDHPNTVLRTYAHLLPHSDAEAAQRAAALLV
jgi:integrase